ncbi:DUF4332 domain-containing protein [Vallitalea pronyensis]|uniref:DUF4332 domain-containing protein n=1 Tax=Vallitalea pronyensis TaxID=1348613 RepID=A0A8J8SGE9_9FIRM|nr:DUF4332 domain-containing protein [Vallitalea pronyensis]QUI22287.1 DUF4332 domain-containing protein [Vallitalea pronyensis]
MGFYIDFGTITMDQYLEKLKKKILIPSRMILREDIDQRFAYFKSIGIKNVLELEKMLKKKDKLSALAEAPCLSEAYLKVLSSELKSIQTKPRKLKDFNGFATDTISKLEACGIKNTRHLFDRVLTPEKRAELAGETGISEQDIMELTQLTDLTRIQWVNTTFARVLYEAGYDTIEKVAHADYQVLYDTIMTLNAERHLYKGHIGLNDMHIVVQAAQEVSIDIT